MHKEKRAFVMTLIYDGTVDMYKIYAKVKRRFGSIMYKKHIKELIKKYGKYAVKDLPEKREYISELLKGGDLNLWDIRQKVKGKFGTVVDTVVIREEFEKLSHLNLLGLPELPEVALDATKEALDEYGEILLPLVPKYVVAKCPIIKACKKFNNRVPVAGPIPDWRCFNTYFIYTDNYCGVYNWFGKKNRKQEIKRLKGEDKENDGSRQSGKGVQDSYGSREQGNVDDGYLEKSRTIREEDML